MRRKSTGIRNNTEERIPGPGRTRSRFAQCNSWSLSTISYQVPFALVNNDTVTDASRIVSDGPGLMGRVWPDWWCQWHESGSLAPSRHSL